MARAVSASGIMARALLAVCLMCSPAMAIDTYLAYVMKKPAYVQALTSVLDRAGGDAPSWTREVLKRNGAYTNGVASRPNIDGTTYEVFSLCADKHRCRDTGMAVMFAPNGTQAWVGLGQGEAVSFLGAPTDAQQAVLKRQLYVPAPTPAIASGPYFFDVIKKPAYARAMASLVSHAGELPNWTREVLKGKGAYNSGTATPVAIYGITYDVFCLCITEFNCTSTSLAVMFAPNGTRAWVLLVQEGATSYLGAPSDAQTQAMRGALYAYGDKWGPRGGK